MPLTRSPEARLVFRSADPACPPEELATLAGAVTEWARLALLADGEMATPTLWRALRDAPVPETMREYLRRGGMFGDFRMKQLADRVAETTAVLHANGVETMLLKGAAVGALADPLFRLRPMTDVDLLVRPEDVPRATAALAEAGWSPTSDPALVELLSEGHQHLPPFLDPRLPGTRLELHVSLFPADHPFAFPLEVLWTESRPAPTPFAGTRIPSTEHLVLHAAIHFAWQHVMRFGAWRTFRLVGMASAHPSFAWSRFVELARTSKAGTAAYWTLRLARRLCDIAVPVEVLAALAPPTPEFARAALERHFVAALVPGEHPPSPSMRLSRVLWRSALRPKWSGHGHWNRWESESRWAALTAGEVPKPLTTRLRDHAAGLKLWWYFVVRTLGGIPRRA